MEVGLIKQFLEKIKELNVNVDSIYIEEDGVTTQAIINDIKLQELRSCSKLLVAFCIGIALKERFKCKFLKQGLKLSP